jgi:hypothetical protein
MKSFVIRTVDLGMTKPVFPKSRRGPRPNPIIDELAREVIAGTYKTDWEAAMKNLHRITDKEYSEDDDEAKHDKINKLSRRIKRRRLEILS